MSMEIQEYKELERKSVEIKKMTLDTIGYLGVGHIGGALSVVDILTLLYYKYMDISCNEPRKKNRDKLVLSKGHAGPALYSVLADKGFFPKEWLHTLNAGGTQLPSHCDMNRTPGIDMTTGSLGQGISAAIGIALANRLDKIDKKIYLIIGDGESNEGQIWEGAMAAAHYKLNHLIAFTDNNKMQIDGYVRDVMNIEDIDAKWSAFGWYVQRVNGHDFREMAFAIERAHKETSRPSMIILDTVKGKGAFFAEGKLENHNMKVDYETARKACEILDQIK
ncbi:transketolase [Parabacteroides pacaensis]|uniref:transketolase n=1 Tax=Parabacteroides pacaensis TaxID=2086575 RepID=UPI0018FE45CC|nr:transketolase [Parabacteroides pacaensis]